METIKGKRTVEVEVEVTTYKFEASSGDYHEELTIVDGEIQEKEKSFLMKTLSY